MGTSFGRKDLCHFNEAMGDALSHGVDRMKAENPLNRQADIAAAMERTPSDLSFMKSGKHQTAQDIFLASSIGLTEPLEELNRQCAAANPKATQERFNKAHVESMQEFNDVIVGIAQAMADGKIDAKEAAMIDLEISQAISALNRLRNQVEGFRK